MIDEFDISRCNLLIIFTILSFLLSKYSILKLTIKISSTHHLKTKFKMKDDMTEEAMDICDWKNFRISVKSYCDLIYMLASLIFNAF